MRTHDFKKFSNTEAILLQIFLTENVFKDWHMKKAAEIWCFEMELVCVNLRE